MVTADESDGKAMASQNPIANDGITDDSSESSKRHVMQSGGTYDMRAKAAADESEC